jgi:hypothetical protein
VNAFDRFGVPVPSMLTTTKPSSASACLSPRATVKARDPTLPDCGPGYALMMNGNFYAGSKLVGRKRMP